MVGPEFVTENLRPRSNFHQYPSVCLIKGHDIVLAIGGQTRSVYEKTVERYSLNNDTWDSCPLLNKQRSRASSCH